MSTDSIIQYNQKKFIVKEYFIKLLCHYACLVMNNNNVSSYSSSLQDVYYWFNLNRVGLGVGGEFDLFLDNFIESTQDELDLIDILAETKSYIWNIGEEISVIDLTDYEENIVTLEEARVTWIKPVMTKSLSNLCDLVIELLSNENFDKDGYYTFVNHEDGIITEIAL